MCEVRDKLARDALERFPYEIKIATRLRKPLMQVGISIGEKSTSRAICQSNW